MNIKEEIICHVLSIFYSEHKGMETWEELNSTDRTLDLESALAWQPFESHTNSEMFDIVENTIESTSLLIERLK